jgi:four helix bundle protein
MKKLRPSGGYRKSASFQTTTLIYDATYWFCEKFIDPRSRTQDQMIQAARSGRQNIAEGSRSAATSSQTELRLVNVARSSLEELLLDYEDYLRHRHMTQWSPSSQEAIAIRDVPQRFRRDQSDRTDLTDLSGEERWALYTHGWRMRALKFAPMRLFVSSIRRITCLTGRLLRWKRRS